MKTRTAKSLLAVLPYILSLAALAALLILGSLRTTSGSGSLPILSALNEADFTVSTDQYSESFIVASLSDTLALPSAAASSENYVSVLVGYKLGQIASSPILEKPNIIDTSSLGERGIITYTVKAGDTLDSIASAYDVTTDDIRWSNNMKNKTITVGQTLYIPPHPGILYTVKSGDSIASLAEKYGSNAEEIETYNDLETSAHLTIGVTIIIPSGTLPEKERPEYVPPAPPPSFISSTNSRTRQNLRYVGNDLRAADCPGNPGAAGQCTWYAWCWRRKYMQANYWLPTGRIGNAGTWTSPYNPAGLYHNFWIDHSPRRGDVVQTNSGSPGHVGVVTAVREGVNITIREMNYNYRAFSVTEAEVPWSVAVSYNYIHQHK